MPDSQKRLGGRLWFTPNSSVRWQLNIRIGVISHLLSPGYSWCHRCKTTWRFVVYHRTPYSDGRGCFPLCENCWTDLAVPGLRLPYYRELWESWNHDLPNYARWEDIYKAVMAGG